MKSPSSDVLAFLHERHIVSLSEMSKVHFLAKHILDYVTDISLDALLYSDMYYPPRPLT